MHPPDDLRRPERVFLREGSPESGIVPVFGDPSRKKTRSGRRGPDDLIQATELPDSLPQQKFRSLTVAARFSCVRIDFIVHRKPSRDREGAEQLSCHSALFSTHTFNLFQNYSFFTVLIQYLHD